MRGTERRNDESLNRILGLVGSECREIVSLRYIDLVSKVKTSSLDELRDLISKFSALSNYTRLQIIEVLSQVGEPLPQCIIAALVGKEPQAITYHLRMLRESGILGEVRRGRFSYYTINTEEIRKLIRFLSKIASTSTPNLI